MDMFKEKINKYKKIIISISSIVFVFSFIMLIKIEKEPIYYEMEYNYTVPESEDKYGQRYIFIFHENGVFNVTRYYNGEKASDVGLYVVNSNSEDKIITIYNGYGNTEELQLINKRSFIINYYYGDEATFLCKEVAVAKSLYVTGLILPTLILSCIYIIYPRVFKKEKQEINIEPEEIETK